MAYEEDIKSRSFWDWIKAHTSFMKPLHRYEEVLELDEQKMTFTGKDVKVDKDFNLEIATGDITDIHLGFDDVFTGWEDRAAPWNKPLSVRYKSKEGEKTIYLFTNFHRKYGFRTSSNKEVYEKLGSYNCGDNMPEKMEYQGVRIRVIAQIIDNAILFTSFGLFHFAVFGTWIRHIPDVATTFATDPICLSFLAVYFVYFIVLEGTVGATVGKLICKIGVKKENGDACGIHKAFVRNMLRIVDGLAFYLVGIILIARSDKKQRLGDRIAKTVVIGSVN